MSTVVKAGIVGASGYSGTELVRILLRHPNVKLECVTSRSLAGKKLSDEMPHLRHIADDISFIKSEPEELAKIKDIDVWFLALPHGVSAEYAKAFISADKKVIDISADFRLDSLELYKQYYGSEHPAPELLKLGKYIIPELFDVKDVQLVACAGCYPTSILLPLVPLLRKGIISGNNIVINSYSAVSGAGKKVDLNFLYCERNESAKGYGFVNHRHLSEIEEQLGIAAKKDVIVQFNPHLCPMNRGISTTITLPANDSSLEDVYACWNEIYKGKPFVKILESGNYPDTAYVANTNRCDISCRYDARTKNFIISSVIDNLVKGASGQAVQIMNLIYNFDERAGLL